MIRATCACGHALNVADTLAGKAVRCGRCAKAVRIPVRRVNRAPTATRVSGGVVAAAVMGVVLAVGGVIVFMASRRDSAKYTPTAKETVAEKYRSAAEAYASAGAGSVEPGEDEKRIVRVMERVVKAHGSGDGAAVVQLMQMRRLIAEIESSGTIEGLRTRHDEEIAIASFRYGMEGAISQVTPPLRWKRLRSCTVRFTPQRPEAQAFCLFENVAGVRIKQRFWLIKEEGTWRVFDFEDLSTGVRMSAELLEGVRIAPNLSAATVDGWRRSREAVQRAIAAVAAEDAAAVERAIREARSHGPAPYVVRIVDALEGTARMMQGRFEEALQCYDQALARHRDMPVLHHARGTALYTLGRYEECIRAEQEYLRILGDDPEAFVILGSAYYDLRKVEEAIAAFRKGIATDAEDWPCRQRLAGVLAERGDIKEAGALFVEAVAVAPDTALCMDDALPRLEAREAWPQIIALVDAYYKREPNGSPIYEQWRAKARRK